MNKEEIKVMIKDGVYSEDGITYMSDKQYNNYINIIEKLQQENKELKEVIDKLSSQIKLYGKYNGEKCTRGFSMMVADFNKLLDILKEVNK